MPATPDPVNAIVLLGFLEEAPASGYDLGRAVEDRFRDLLGISRGTLYYTLKRLEQKGWIRGTREREGRRPERRVYRATAEGRRALAQLLEQAARGDDPLLTPFDVALYFAPRMDPARLLEAVDHQLDRLRRARAALSSLEERFPVRWPYHLYYLREKTREVSGARERWWLRLRRKVQSRTPR
jgi:DNA-binding PadR family transcriptional regulator